uniref:Uncharacterized protein n=1 Tax=Anguilla anguilla TaxID=7936 RepID=A0A0E9S0B0_ANGAN
MAKPCTKLSRALYCKHRSHGSAVFRRRPRKLPDRHRRIVRSAGSVVFLVGPFI